MTIFSSQTLVMFKHWTSLRLSESSAQKSCSLSHTTWSGLLVEANVILKCLWGLLINNIRLLLYNFVLNNTTVFDARLNTIMVSVKSCYQNLSFKWIKIQFPSSPDRKFNRANVPWGNRSHWTGHSLSGLKIQKPRENMSYFKTNNI